MFNWLFGGDHPNSTSTNDGKNGTNGGKYYMIALATNKSSDQHGPDWSDTNWSEVQHKLNQGNTTSISTLDTSTNIHAMTSQSTINTSLTTNNDLWSTTTLTTATPSDESKTKYDVEKYIDEGMNVSQTYYDDGYNSNGPNSTLVIDGHGIIGRSEQDLNKQVERAKFETLITIIIFSVLVICLITGILLWIFKTKIFGRKPYPITAN